MKNLVLFMAMFLFAYAQSANANSQIFVSQMVYAANPVNQGCVANQVHFNDVVNNLNSGYKNFQAFAVAEPSWGNYNQVVNFVGNHQVSSNRVRVIVRNGILRRVALGRANQARVNCVAVVVNQHGQVVSRRVVRSRLFEGRLVGALRRAVFGEVRACQRN